MAENEVITTNYIYLLQLREFVKTKENVYKVGRTTQENHKRFAQYPKGSVLLFQMICNDCVCVEKDVLEKFRQNFKQRKDFGNEYFEGDYRNMIDVIYLVIKDEGKKCVNEVETKVNDEVKKNNHPNNQITTYKEWIKYSGIDKIIIKTTGYKQAYVKYKGCPWIVLALHGDMFTEFSLKGFIKQCQKDICFDIEKIWKDTLDTCCIEDYKFYNTPRHEYVVPRQCSKSGKDYNVFNAINMTFTPLDEVIGDKILAYENCYCSNIIFNTNNISDLNINIVEDILKSLILNDVLIQYKKLMYNLVVKCEEKQIIFYDYNECLLTTWVQSLLTMIGVRFLESSEFYRNDELNDVKLVSESTCRCVIIPKNNPANVPIEEQLKDFCSLGNIQVIVVCQNEDTKKMYDIPKYKKYLNDNKDLIIKCLDDNNNSDFMTWQIIMDYDDSIFYNPKYLQTNFLKWCCTKSP